MSQLAILIFNLTGGIAVANEVETLLALSSANSIRLLVLMILKDCFCP